MSGCDYRYAAEQIMLHLFPDEKPVFRTKAESLPKAEISLRKSKTFTSITVKITSESGAFTETVRRKIRDSLPEAEQSRLERRILQLAFYRASMKAGVNDAPWGACAGIRPSTQITKLLLSGLTARASVAYMCRELYVTPKRAELALDCAQAELAACAALTRRSIAVYIGIPFCPTRCAYCSFVSSSVEHSLGLIQPFLDLLHREIKAVAAIIRAFNLSVECIYIGGGTPTTLSADQLDNLLALLSDQIDMSTCREFTVEAGRPDTITEMKLRVMKNRGVNRVSVNPQTFSDNVLRAIGRGHNTEETYRAYNLTRDAGFRSVNMDLIAGLPADDFDGFRRSLDKAIELNPENLTVHTLSRKNGSAITVNRIPTPDSAEVTRIVNHSIDCLRGKGYEPYYLYRQKYQSGGLENTGWTKPSFECLYNIIMMDECRTVLSLGGGGVSKLIPPEGRLTRVFNPKYPYEYINREDQILDKSKIRSFFEETMKDDKD